MEYYISILKNWDMERDGRNAYIDKTEKYKTKPGWLLANEVGEIQCGETLFDDDTNMKYNSIKFLQDKLETYDGITKCYDLQVNWEEEKTITYNKIGAATKNNR